MGHETVTNGFFYSICSHPSDVTCALDMQLSQTTVYHSWTHSSMAPLGHLLPHCKTLLIEPTCVNLVHFCEHLWCNYTYMCICVFASACICIPKGKGTYCNVVHTLYHIKILEYTVFSINYIFV